LQTHIKEFESRNVAVIGISTSTVGELKEKMLPMGFTFPLLADPELTVIDAYGLRHVAGYPMGGDISRPAIIVVGPTGLILEKMLPDNWRVRPTPQTILEELGFEVES
tara:strand:- start:2987 stop:3310 length:324 start_codon:yes stop_codon:yes gene_type:complete